MKYLRFIYGKGTHNLRVLNFILCSMWLLLMIASLSGDLSLALPDNPRFETNWMGILLVVSLATTGLSFIITGVEGAIFRFLSLATGAGVHELVIERYTSTYPPLDIMTIVATILTLWFLGGALFICKDRNNGIGKTHHTG